MTCGFTQVSEEDSFSIVDLDDVYVTETEFIDQYINKDGTLWSWGYNDNLTTGLNVSAVTKYSSPVQVGSLTNWKQVSVGNLSSSAIKTDGTLWVWGWSGSAGGLGLGGTVQVSSPVQVGSLTNWKQVATSPGLDCSHAIKTDSTLWSWGYNGNGELGLNDRTHRNSPVQVGTLTNWKSISSSHTIFAIKTDGTLWVWGDTSFGSNGLNGAYDKLSSPVQVGSLTNWKQVASIDNSKIAIKTDNTLWSWGYNNNGQLGQNDRTNLSSPVQVGSLNNWKLISAGFENISAIKTDGTLWTWGLNSNGQLGLGDIAKRSSPVQVGSLTNWKLISNGSNYTIAIKTDGTLWAWGNNAYGQLGLGDLVHRSSPVQVGSLTNWKQITSLLSTSAIQQ